MSVCFLAHLKHRTGDSFGLGVMGKQRSPKRGDKGSKKTIFEDLYPSGFGSVKFYMDSFRI